MYDNPLCPYCGPWNGHPDGVGMIPDTWQVVVSSLETKWRADFRCPFCHTRSPATGIMNSLKEAVDEANSIALRRFQPMQKPMTLQEVTERLKGESRFPAWVEQYNNGICEKAYATRAAIGNTGVKRCYNKAMSENYCIGFRYWDCKEKPTAEERAAAKWEE